MSTATPQKFEFQTEIKQLLDIVIHSLYTEKEIFVRELVSNASDALEKLRHLQLTEKEIFDDKLDLEINLTTDDKAKTITIQDFGLGMSRAELIENLLFGELGVAQFFERVRGVGDEFADEDFLLRVERVDDDIEQLLDLGLELEFLRSGGGHGGWVDERC